MQDKRQRILAPTISSRYKSLGAFAPRSFRPLAGTLRQLCNFYFAASRTGRLREFPSIAQLSGAFRRGTSVWGECSS